MIRRPWVLVLAALLVMPAGAGAGAGAYALQKREVPEGTPPEVRKQIEHLYSLQRDARVRAVMALEKLGPKASAAIPFLKDLLADARRVGMTTHYVKEGRRVFGLPTVGRLAADALMDINQAQFGKLLADKSAQTRRCAVEALAEAGRGGVAMELLMRAMKDADPAVRKSAAWGLHLHQCKPTKDALLKATSDASAMVRMAAAYSLGQMKAIDSDKKILTSLIKTLESDKDKRCRATAAWALGRFGNNSHALSALDRAAKDSDKYVGFFANKALKGWSKNEKAYADLMMALWRDSAWGQADLRKTSQPAPRKRSPSRRSSGTRRPSGYTPRRVGAGGFRLGGTMSGPSGMVAIINGRPVSVGGTVNGAKVVKITSFSVELERDGKRFTVTR